MFGRLASFFSSAAPRDLSFGLLKTWQVGPLIKQQQWQQVEELASKLDSDELSRLVDGICLSNQFNKQIQRFGQQNSGEFAQLLLGSWYLYQAWQARSGQWAENLSKSQEEGFAHYLLLARVLLGSSFATLAFLSEARARLVRVEMGLNESNRAMTAFYQSTAVNPDKFWAHHHVFKLVSPKWLGDEDELAGYIQSVENQTLRQTLWLMFLVEMYSDAEFAEESSALGKWYNTYQQLITEVLEQPQPPVGDTLSSIYANNNLAYLYHLIGEREKRNAVLQALDGCFPPYPWDYFGIEVNSASGMKSFLSSPARILS